MAEISGKLCLHTERKSAVQSMPESIKINKSLIALAMHAQVPQPLAL